MNRLNICLLTILFLSILPSKQNEVQAQNKAYDVLDAFLKAIGGKENINSINSIHSITSTTDKSKKFDYKFSTVTSAITENYYKKVNGKIVSAGRMTYYSNGKQVLKNLIYFDGERIQSRRKSYDFPVVNIDVSWLRESFAVDTELISFSDYLNTNIYRNWSYGGIEKLNGNDYHKLSYRTLNSKIGWVTNYAYFDVKTFLLFRTDNYLPSGDRRYSNYTYNYQLAGNGLLFPTEKYLSHTEQYFSVKTTLNPTNIPSGTFSTNL